jgi:hypothetical protein
MVGVNFVFIGGQSGTANGDYRQQQSQDFTHRVKSSPFFQTYFLQVWSLPIIPNLCRKLPCKPYLVDIAGNLASGSMVWNFVAES